MQKATCFPLLFCITGIAQMLWLWPQHCFFKVPGHVDDGIYSWSPWELCFLACDTCPCWRWYKTKSFNSDALRVFILFGGREGNGDPTPQLFHRRIPILIWPIQTVVWMRFQKVSLSFGFSTNLEGEIGRFCSMLLIDLYVNISSSVLFSKVPSGEATSPVSYRSELWALVELVL